MSPFTSIFYRAFCADRGFCPNDNLGLSRLRKRAKSGCRNRERNPCLATTPWPMYSLCSNARNVLLRSQTESRSLFATAAEIDLRYLFSECTTNCMLVFYFEFPPRPLSLPGYKGSRVSIIPGRNAIWRSSLLPFALADGFAAHQIFFSDDQLVVFNMSSIDYVVNDGSTSSGIWM